MIMKFQQQYIQKENKKKTIKFIDLIVRLEKLSHSSYRRYLSVCVLSMYSYINIFRIQFTLTTYFTEIALN